VSNSPSRAYNEDGRSYAFTLPHAFKAWADKTLHFTFKNSTKYSSEHKNAKNELLHSGNTYSRKNGLVFAQFDNVVFQLQGDINIQCLFYGVSEQGTFKVQALCAIKLLYRATLVCFEVKMTLQFQNYSNICQSITYTQSLFHASLFYVFFCFNSLLTIYITS